MLQNHSFSNLFGSFNIDTSKVPITERFMYTSFRKRHMMLPKSVMISSISEACKAHTSFRSMDDTWVCYLDN